MMDEDERRIRADERSRLQAILGSPEAKGRERQAQTLALTTDLSPAACEEILRSSARTNSLDLDARMAGRQPLDLDPDEPQGASAAHANSINWDEITAQTNAELGVKRPGR